MAWPKPRPPQLVAVGMMVCCIILASMASSAKVNQRPSPPRPPSPPPSPPPCVPPTGRRTVRLSFRLDVNFDFAALVAEGLDKEFVLDSRQALATVFHVPCAGE